MNQSPPNSTSTRTKSAITLALVPRLGYNNEHDCRARQVKVHGPTHDGEKICHIVPEDDPDTALCGKDVTGWPWNPPWPYCMVCLDLAGYDVTS